MTKTLESTLTNWIESATSQNDLELNAFSAIMATHNASIDENTDILVNLYSKTLLSQLNSDKEFSSASMQFISRLAFCFEFEANEIQIIHGNVLGIHYESRVREAYATLFFSEELEKELNVLKNMYCLSDKLVSAIMYKVGNDVVSSLFDEFDNNVLGGMSTIKQFVDSLPYFLSKELTDRYNQFVSKYNSLKNPSTIKLEGIFIDEKENVYLKCNADKQKLVAGAYVLDTRGELLISNRGIRFIGMNKSINLKYNAIASFRFVTDGILIQKKAGLSQLFQIDPTEVNIDDFSSMIEMLHKKACK